MNGRDVEIQAKRISDYRSLSTRADELRNLINIIQTGGPARMTDSPFTGNALESRRVRRMEIFFTETLGRESTIELNITNLNVSARELGDFLLERLDKQLKEVEKAMEAL